MGLHEIDGADDDLAGQTLSTPFWGERDVMARFLDFENYAWNFGDYLGDGLVFKVVCMHIQGA